MQAYNELWDPEIEQGKMKHIYDYLKQLFNSGHSVQFV
jgi:hypothetical protein